MSVGTISADVDFRLLGLLFCWSVCSSFVNRLLAEVCVAVC